MVPTFTDEVFSFSDLPGDFNFFSTDTMYPTSFDFFHLSLTVLPKYLTLLPGVSYTWAHKKDREQFLAPCLPFHLRHIHALDTRYLTS